jgi:hypothetical protein
METINLKQITETIQAYFDNRNIKETAEVSVENKEMTYIFRLHTSALLNYEHMVNLNHIFNILMPRGTMHELINVATQKYGEQKLTVTTDTIELDFKISLPPGAVPLDEPTDVQPGPHPGITREFINIINTSDSVTMPVSKKKKNK